MDFSIFPTIQPNSISTIHFKIYWFKKNDRDRVELYYPDFIPMGTLANCQQQERSASLWWVLRIWNYHGSDTESLDKLAPQSWTVILCEWATRTGGRFCFVPEVLVDCSKKWLVEAWRPNCNEETKLESYGYKSAKLQYNTSQFYLVSHFPPILSYYWCSKSLINLLVQ